MNESWEVESAALIGYHTGKNPDHRAMSTLREKGIINYSHKARPVSEFVILQKFYVHLIFIINLF